MILRIDTRRTVVIALIGLGLLIGALRLLGPTEDLYPVEGDSAKYHGIARGFSSIYSHPVSSLKLWITRGATPQDMQRIGFDSWVLQHAPAYTAVLGLFYLLPGDDVGAGRFATVLIFAIGAALLFLLGKELFGFWPGLVASIVYLFWPAHWVYAPAILTEVPMAVAGIFAAHAMVTTGRSDRYGKWVLGGAAIGLMVLCKTPLRYVAIPWIVIEALVDRTGGRPRVLKRGALRIAGWGATQLIWLVFLWGFNLSPNPLKHLGEDWLWVYRGDYVPDRGWESVGIGDALTPELEEGGRRAQSAPPDEMKGAVYREAFLATLRNYPGGMLSLVLAKAGIYWQFPASKTFIRAGPVSLPPPIRLQPAIAILALFGLAVCVGPGWGRRLLPAAIPVFLTALYSATHLVSRYNIPAVPFAFLYGAGAAGALCDGLRPILSRRDIDPGTLKPIIRRWGPAVLAAAAGLVIGGLMLRTVTLRLLGPAVMLMMSGPLLFVLFGGGRRGLTRVSVVLIPLIVLGTGSLADDPDADAGRVALRMPGDGVRLSLDLPSDAQPERFAGAEVLLDLLPSVKGRSTLSVRLSGQEIARYVGRLESGPESFLLDREIHREGDRYRRILRSMERHLDGFVRLQRGMKDAGYDYYRQWYRIPVAPALAFHSPNPVLEIILVSTEGGSVDLYIDRTAPATGSPVRVISMPAFFENAYELSYYRFDTLSARRELADSRMTRPVAIQSSRRGAEFFDSRGRTRQLSGEPRMRLRGRLVGGYGLVKAGAEGGGEAGWLDDPTRALRELTPKEILFLQSDRDHYFSGYLTF